MNLDVTRQVANTYGYGAAAHDLALRAASRLARTAILHAMVLRPERLSPSSFAGSDEGWGFLGEAELRAFARKGNAELDEAFVDDAIARGDRCFAQIAKGEIAAYGWYARVPTPYDSGLVLTFDPAYAYMYKGFTAPAHRGKRLHGIGMARALRALAAEGAKGLVSYVRSNNFASLRSCARLGYETFGKVLVVRMPGRDLVATTPGCRPFGFAVVRAAELEAGERPASASSERRAA